MRILSLTTKDFLTGIAGYDYDTETGLWSYQNGVTVIRNPKGVSRDFGLIQPAQAPTEVTGLTNTPLSYVKRVTGSGAGTLYIGESGGVSIIDLSVYNNNASSLLTVPNMTNGLELFAPKDSGEEYLLYWQTTQIGRYGDLNGTPTQTDAWATGLENTNYHPTHKMWDEIYYGNKNKIGRIKDDLAGGMTHSANVLDFEDSMLVTALEDDGEMLVIGMSTNQGDNDIYGDTLVRFWKINSYTWSYEHRIPEPNIISLKRIGGTIYALCPNGIYYFNRYTKPKKIVSFDDYSFIGSLPQFGRDRLLAGFGEVILYGHHMTGVFAFGRFFRNNPVAHNLLYDGSSSYIPNKYVSLIISDARADQILVGVESDGTNSTLWRFVHSDTTSNSGGSIRTVYIPLGGRFQLKEFEFIFAEELPSNTNIEVSVSTEYPAYTHQLGNITDAKFGNKKKISLYKGIDSVEAFSLNLTFYNTGDAPKIKQINIYGDRED